MLVSRKADGINQSINQYFIQSISRLSNALFKKAFEININLYLGIIGA